MSDAVSPSVLLIVWHSRTGASEQLALCAQEGAFEALAALDATHTVTVSVQPAREVSTDAFLQAHAYLFCAPENLGTLSGEMKEFFDRLYYHGLDRIAGRPYALAIAAGSDGTGAVRQAERICTGWRLRQAAPAFIAHTQAQTSEAIMAPKQLTPEQVGTARTLGGTLAALLA